MLVFQEWDLVKSAEIRDALQFELQMLNRNRRFGKKD
jgi:hypothetical protein